jgi:hypothetical protein
MMTTATVTAMDGIVLIAVGFTLVFVAAWISSPTLRAWIERPKYRFLADVKGYDWVIKQDFENDGH